MDGSVAVDGAVRRLRFATWNVNGLRSAIRQGFEAWLEAGRYDVVCLQEIKVGEDLLTAIAFPGYDVFWNPARKPGYSGVATLVRHGLGARLVDVGVGDAELDGEGRVLCVEVAGVRFVNVYAPHSQRQLLRLDAKVRFQDLLARRLPGDGSDPPSVFLGDFNVAHRDEDLANPRENRGNAGFLPVERAWVELILGRGYVDAFRRFHGGNGHYTWWSQRQGVRERNVGWRIDYAFVDARLADALVACRHLPEARGSDHCPVEAEIALPVRAA